MFRSSILRITCALTIAVSPATLGGAPRSTGAVTLDQVLAQISARQKTIETLQSGFRQEKTMAMMASPQVSTGTFAYSKPDRVIWTYGAPSPVTMLIRDGWLTTWYPQLNKAEKLEIGSYQERIFRYMAAPGSLDELQKYFDFTFRQSRSEPVYTLELIPKTKTLEKRVKRITLWIDRDSLLTTKFEYVDGGGDLTRYEFRDVKINEPLPADMFELNLPAGVRVEQMRIN